MKSEFPPFPFLRSRRFESPFLKEVACPVGGIGTGTISVTGNGALAEWQIRNRPAVDTFNPYSFAALWAAPDGQPATARVLEGPMAPPYHRHPWRDGATNYVGLALGAGGFFGLPRFDQVRFHAAYPFVGLEFLDPSFPLQVAVEAWNPLCPGQVEASSVPGLCFRLHLQNPLPAEVRFSLALTLRNPIGLGPESTCEEISDRGLRALVFGSRGIAEDDPEFGTVAIATPWKEGFTQCRWPQPPARTGFMQHLRLFWDAFSQTGRLEPSTVGQPIGTLGLTGSLKPGGRVTLPYWITWSFPTTEYRLGTSTAIGQGTAEAARKPRWRTAYASRFPNALSVAEHLRLEGESLHRKTAEFRRGLEGSELSEAELDAVSTALIPLRSPTSLFLEDGTFYGYEGVCEAEGCCPGSCTHVGAYAYAPIHVFPSLEQSMREASFRCCRSSDGSGALAHRLEVPPKPRADPCEGAADGLLAEIIRVFWVWKRTGDGAWAASMWEGVRQAIEYARRAWDFRGRGMIEGAHHCTYDVDLVGPDPLATGYYICALQAASRLAVNAGEDKLADAWEAHAATAAEAMDAVLFNGEYYRQIVDHVPPDFDCDVDGFPLFQIGQGCLSDQLAGISLGMAAGLPLLLDPEHVRRALLSIFRFNFRDPVGDFVCCSRVMALPHESALQICSFPYGERPRFPIAYWDECGWTGVEYQVASLMKRMGLREESREIVEAVRARHDGKHRNPFNEYECGSYYARSMAAWGLVL